MSSGGPSHVSGCSGCTQINAAQCRAGDGLLHRHGQHAPPVLRPTGRRRCAECECSPVSFQPARTKVQACSFQRPPTYEPNTTSCCRPPWESSAYVVSFRRSATLSAAPSTTAAQGSRETRAWPRRRSRAGAGLPFPRQAQRLSRDTDPCSFMLVLRAWLARPAGPCEGRQSRGRPNRRQLRRTQGSALLGSQRAKQPVARLRTAKAPENFFLGQSLWPT